MISPAELLASLPEAVRAAEIKSLSDRTKAELLYHWPFWARPNQLAPKGDWTNWVINAGRGFGKTRSGSEWVRSMVCGSTPLGKGRAIRVALIGETAADGRDVMVEGESGLLSVHPKAFRPIYEPSKRRVTWPNGAVATVYNATEPDQLRGPQHDLGWCDELAKWRYAQETWDMLQFGMRLGSDPRQLITTTPRPIQLLKKIMSDPRTVVTRGSTFENSANLAKPFLDNIKTKYEGTRLGRQELDAEILDDVPGSLWTREMIDKTRRMRTDKLPDMQRVVISIDPAGKSQETAVSEGTAETGIIAAGIGTDGRGYVLDDLTCSLSPSGWARRAISAYDMYAADAIVVETNQGGDMVKATLQSIRPGINVIEVTASRGKVTRAEPISALYEQGRISHVGSFGPLEDQMVLFTPLGIAGETTGDRVDALVWGLTQLFPSIVNKVETHNWDFGGAASGGDAWLRA
ncbi:MAG: DNA-packaging protein [Betaproteobacteria bacterium]|nr:DNA-packaging protein [Betaproteobacteria bacterium]